jgi:ABC-2 type transport system permease protein
VSALTETAPAERQIHGPSALTGDPRRFLHLTWTLAVQEFKLRFFGSVLGYLWQLVRPLLLFGVLYFVFTKAIKLGASAPFFPAVLLTNIVLFSFFAEATTGAVTSVVDRENLVRKISFPRLVVPAAVVLTALFNLAVNLIAVAVFVFATGVDVRLTWLEFPVLIAVLATFAAGVAMLLSALYVRMRDLRPIWEVVMQVLFYATPIIYVLETVDSVRIRHLMMGNPLAMVLQQVRHAVIDADAPSAGQAIGGWPWLAIPIAIVVLAAVVGFWVYDREAPSIAEDL